LAHFNLDEVREAAAQQKIQYKGRKVQKDVANLGYTLKEVADYIVSLTANDFKETKVYDDQIVHDVYIKTRTDRIYIKLRLLDNQQIQIVEVGSFHL